MKKVVLIVFMLALAVSVKAQRTCATTNVNELNKNTEQLRIEKEAFENWLVQKKKQIISQNALQGLTETTVYQIPVVVHIIHNGEAEGVGLNITKEQIDAQIAALNIDFRHLNADSINTPAIFQPLMADIGFEFILAKRDPSGLPTNGITRTNGNQAIWTFGENTELKSISYWSTDDYFNIWVAPLGTSWLGWAEYPTSELIDGVNEIAENNPLTDGVVINTLAFGSEELYPQGNYLSNFDLGRTTTHEVGHFFGLRHVWGDGACGVDDYVIDTPDADDSTNFCPEIGPSTTSCGSQDMFMNYMDYVNDDCMNLFSIGQKDRMIIVVNNSPRRASLLTSLALEPPPPLDAAVTALPNPGSGICDNHIYPTVTIQNTGVTSISEVSLSVSVNQVVAGQQTFAISLNTSQDTTLLLPDFFLAQYGTLTISAEILSINGLNDNISENNTFNKQVFYSEVVTSMHEEFTSWPESWAIRTEAPVSQWNFSQAPNMVIENTAAVLRYYENNSAFLDHLVSPVIDLSSYTKPYLLFDYAYGQITNSNDMLAVVVSLDCGNTFPDTLFLKSGSELATTEIPVRFTPSGPIDWQTAMLDLSVYGTQSVQIDIVGKSEGGNDIYLDNFFLVDEGYIDISMKGLLNEAAAYSSGLSSLGLIMENTGATTVDNLVIEVREGTSLISSQEFSNLNLVAGERRTVNLDNQITSGKHDLEIKHLLIDAVPANNQLQITANLLDVKEQIPFREKFNGGSWDDNNWSVSSPIDNIEWQFWSETGGYLYYQGFSKGNIGLHDWLVLPMLDFSEANVATIQYKIAYASNDFNNEALRIWVSINSGKSFDYLVESLTSQQMATASSNTEWHPVIEDDWASKYIDLSEFAGEENVLIAFETIDGDGNNIYLDDIELFIADEPNMIEVEEDQMAIYPNPVSDFNARISFNLGNKQNVNIRILDVQGKVLSNQQITNVLNQTYPLDLSTQRTGIYIIQATGDSFNDVMRILVSN